MCCVCLLCLCVCALHEPWVFSQAFALSRNHIVIGWTQECMPCHASAVLCACRVQFHVLQGLLEPVIVMFHEIPMPGVLSVKTSVSKEKTMSLRLEAWIRVVRHV